MPEITGGVPLSSPPGYMLLIYCDTVWQESFMIIKDFTLPLNYFDKNITDFNFTEAHFHTHYHGDVQ